MKNLLVFILLSPLVLSCQAENAVSKYPAQVGDISFDKKIDDEFERCVNDKLTFQYYNDANSFNYKGEKIEIQRKLAGLHFQSDQTANGYITIRFVVNCDGKTGLFRVQQMNTNYEESTFNKKLNGQLLNFTKNLDGWIPKEYLGVKLNYYQYLTFKIENGKVSEILP